MKMNQSKFAFAGNRAFVLQKMGQLNLNIIKIWAVKDSYLQRYLDSISADYSLITDKESLIREISETDFDYFISNGLPIILPVSRLTYNNNKKFINIHPSLLPDLKGRDPVPGALLYGKPSGATCHIMNDAIDDGDIISQVEIPNTDDLDAGLLYQLSFKAEAQVFEEAFFHGFKASTQQPKIINPIYYSFSEKDLMIDFQNDSCEAIINKVRAFSTGNKGARYIRNGKVYVTEHTEIISNPFCCSFIDELENEALFLQYENVQIIKVHGQLMKFVLRRE